MTASNTTKRIVWLILESRLRRWVRGALAVGLILVVGLPLADEYRALRTRGTTLSTELTEVYEQLDGLDALKKKKDSLQRELTTLQSGNVTEIELARLRGEIIQLAREAECRIRKVQVGEIEARPWSSGDDLRAAANQGDAKNQQFELASQKLTISAVGSVSGLRKMLNSIQRQPLLLQVKQVNLNPEPENPLSSVLDLEISTYQLRKRVAKPGDVGGS